MVHRPRAAPDPPGGGPSRDLPEPRRRAARHRRPPAAGVSTQDAEQAANQLVERLLHDSGEFAALWREHEVRSRSGTTTRLVRPGVGTITLDCHILTGENQAGRLVVFAPQPGTRDGQLLDALAGGADVRQRVG